MELELVASVHTTAMEFAYSFSYVRYKATVGETRTFSAILSVKLLRIKKTDIGCSPISILDYLTPFLRRISFVTVIGVFWFNVCEAK